MLVGIMGYKRSGKDTVATILQDLAPDKFKQRFAFADQMKEDLAKIFNLDPDVFWSETKDYDILKVVIKDDEHDKIFNQLHGGSIRPFLNMLRKKGYITYGRKPRIIGRFMKDVEVLNISTRKLLQFYGTDFMQDRFGQNVWLKNAPTQDAIITDVRFPHEINFIKDNGGVLVKVMRLDMIDVHLKENSRNLDKHISESMVTYNDQDYIILNPGESLSGLTAEVQMFLNDMEMDGLL